MKVCIIGAQGFIGSCLLEYLSRNENLYIVAIDKQLPAVLTNKSNIEWKKKNLLSHKDCIEIAREDSDVILYLAHSSTPLKVKDNIASETSTNIFPLLNLLEAVKLRKKPAHMIYPSSGGTVYGHSKNKKPFTEEDPPAPVSLYAIEKITNEHYLRYYSERFSMSTTILRISNPYGVLLPLERKQGLIGIVINQIKQNEPIYIYGDPHNVRDYIHIRDVCVAFEICLENTRNYEVYNVGSGQGHSVNEVLSIIERISGIKAQHEIVNDGNEKYLLDWNVLDITKAQKELSWSPKISIEEGIELLWEEVQSAE
jgi:UDP-glucose 4-epimerase